MVQLKNLRWKSREENVANWLELGNKWESLLSNSLARFSSELHCDLELLDPAQGTEFLLCEEVGSNMPGPEFLRLEEAGPGGANMPGTEFLRLEGPGLSKVNTSSRSSLSDPAGGEVGPRLRSPFLLSLLLRLDLLLDDEEAVVEVSLQEDLRSLGFLKLGIFHGSPDLLCVKVSLSPGDGKTSSYESE